MIITSVFTWIMAHNSFKKKDFLVIIIIAISFFSSGAIFSTNNWAKADIDTLINAKIEKERLEGD